MWLYVLIVLASSAIFGAMSKDLAAKKGYEGYFWVGFLLNIAGLIYVAGLPECKATGVPEYATTICKKCGYVNPSSRYSCSKCNAPLK